jgi:hypothetical protein
MGIGLGIVAERVTMMTKHAAATGCLVCFRAVFANRLLRLSLRPLTCLFSSLDRRIALFAMKTGMRTYIDGEARCR